jgi:uncharacterized DUF497 family protein
MADATLVYEFEWDPEKRRINQRKHGVPFEEAATVFLDPRAISLYDEEHSEQEDRWITVGFSSTGRILVVCHTFQPIDEWRCRVRIIMCRKATRCERGQYGK